jgi:hypothetical protein
MKRNIFDESKDFSERLFSIINMPLIDNSKRVIISDVSCSMALEHWSATMQLLKDGLLPSAIVVHRAQFEAILRSIWLLHGANDRHVSKLSAALTLETEQDAKNLPSTADMMASLSKSGPAQAFDALNRFKENSWKALNSYAHAGIHPIRRHAEGYPAQLIEDMAKNSNGLAIISAMQAVVLAGAQPVQQEILNLASQYDSCMPPPL